MFCLAAPVLPLGAQDWLLSAGLDIQATTGLSTQPLSPRAGLGVLALWALGAMLLGGLAFRLRDA